MWWMSPFCWWCFHHKFGWERCQGWWGWVCKLYEEIWSLLQQNLGLLNWDQFSKEFPVTQGSMSRTINMNNILINNLISTMGPVLSHFSGWGPVWFWTCTWSPTQSGGNCLVCCVHHSAARIWRFLRASSLLFNISIHVGWGSYLPGRIGIKSFMGLPNKHIAGDPICESGVMWYWSMALCKVSVSRLQWGPVFDVIILFAVLTPISALQFEWGNVTEDRWWLTPQFIKKVEVAVATNSDQPSQASSSGIPKVANSLHRQ